MDQQRADEAALRDDVGAVEIERDVIEVAGPDAIDYLQGQVSQDVAAIDVGGGAWSLLLEPQGKLVAWIRLLRRASDAVLVDVTAGFGPPVLERLQRFKLRTDAELSLSVGWRSVALRGRGVEGFVASRPDLSRVTGAVALGPIHWPGVGGVDLVGPEVTVPEGVRRCGRAAYEAVRIGAGVPEMGSELVEGLIPAEAGIVAPSVSWTKGCYTGQELVARIDSRGSNTPRRLVHVDLGADRGVPPEPGAELKGEAGAVVGRLTSVAWSAAAGRWTALAFVARGQEVPGRAEVDGRPAELGLLPALGEVPAASSSS